MRKTQKSQKDERPAKLRAVETFDLKYLLILNEVARDLIAENHPLALKLATAVQAINFTHDARSEIVQASKEKPKQANLDRKTEAQILHERIYADSLKVKNKRSNWKASLAQKYGKKPSTIGNIVSKMKKVSK